MYRMTVTMITRPVCSVHKTLIRPECMAHSLFGEMFASCRNNVPEYTCSDLVPLEMTFTCAGKGHVILVLCLKKVFKPNKN